MIEEAAKVAPLRKERQLREILGALTAILSSDLDDAEEDLDQLREWLDLASFMSARDGKFLGPKPAAEFGKQSARLVAAGLAALAFIIIALIR